MTTIFFVVSAICALCMLPFLLARLLRATTHVLDNLQAPAALVLYEVAVRSYLLHAPLKPLVYLLLNHSFRRECRHLVLKLWAFCAGNPTSAATSPPH
ncbi:hypothetical protein C0Q70_14090 [Pomacea canaliculata]|uniref:G-protein coupled receptors family 1 profile domain-containing protein n=1 Tax=Pomacea canaliculata TaxID=400727 RepID=A0A2T7NZ18_POMCA|nr:hypothetical protein C0Q70_14090 [Pomacea canaliculata]